MQYTTPDRLTAAMLTRITAGGTINPARVPQTATHYRQVGQLFYPQLAQCFARVAHRWGYADMRGDEMAGYMAVQCATLPGGAHRLHDMARLELALGDMQPGPLAQAQAAIVAYMCGAIQAPANTPYGGDPATFEACDIWARPALALTAATAL